MLELKLRGLIAVLVILIISVLISGCYTIVGYPPEAEEGVIEEDIVQGRTYRHYGYYYDYPYYYWDDFDLYYPYRWDPYYYDYWYGPWWYDDYYHWDYDYYVPEKKPETRKREASDLHRSSKLEQKKSPAKPKDIVQPKEKRGSSDESQKSVRKQRDSRSKSKSQDEEKKRDQ